MDADAILDNVRLVAAAFAAERAVRQQRRSIDRGDFDRLREAGFLLTGVPIDQGGIWESVRRSTRPVCEMLRTLASGDSSVALVCAMHPSVLSFWLATPDAPAAFQDGWRAQRRHFFETAREGAWWGTITSESGSGGDISRTAATARRAASDGPYRLTGQKQFGSGSGMASYMITAAVPEGEPAADLFVLDMRDVAWDGSTGVTLVAPWDGHGMAATQSHAMAFADVPVVRSAWPGAVPTLMGANGGFMSATFTAVIAGIAQTAVETARQHVRRRHDSMRAYERVEWSRAEMEGWLIQQAYEGILRAVERGEDGRRQALLGKMAIAELAESMTGRLCRIVGGGTFSRSSPFGHWHEDVRALGFLRPPWGLAYDNLFEWSASPPA